MKKRMIAVFCTLLIAVSMLAGCKKKKAPEYAATVNGVQITRPIFTSALNQALNDLYAEQPEGLTFDKSLDFYNQIRDTKAADGRTYYEVLVENAMQSAQHFMINMELAKADSTWPSDKELQESGDKQRASIESSYSYYMSAYGWDADDLMIALFGMTASDYAEYYAISAAVDAFNQAKMKAMEVTAEQLEAFYAEHEDELRIVTVRHSLFMTTDLSDSEKSKVLEKVNGYVEKYRNGEMTMDEIVALSEDTGVTSNDGYYDVVADGSYVKEFEDWAVSRKTVDDSIEVVESDYGYHVMQCTKIATYEDETVQKNTDSAYRAAQITDELDTLAGQEKYAIANRQNSTIERFVKQIITGNFDNPDATPAPTAEPTAKPEYHDDPANTDKVGMMGDVSLWYADFMYFFGSAVSELVTPNFNFDEDATTAERYQALRDFLQEPYPVEDGEAEMTYMQKCQARALELLVQFKASWQMAAETEEPYDEEKLQTLNDQLDQMIDQYLAYYGEAYGVTTRDEYMQYVMGMNVNDYKRFNIEQSFISDYSQKVIEAMEPTEDDYLAYYAAHTDLYRTVTVRHIFLSLVDTKGEALPEEEQQKVRELANRLMTKLRNGDSPEAIVIAWSDSSTASSDKGLADVTEKSNVFTKEILSWCAEQTETGISTLRLFETEEGLEILFVEGITTYSEQTGIASSSGVSVSALQQTVQTAYKNDAFLDQIKAYIAEHGLEATDLNQAMMDKAAEEYLTYDETAEE